MTDAMPDTPRPERTGGIPAGHDPDLCYPMIWTIRSIPSSRLISPSYRYDTQAEGVAYLTAHGGRGWKESYTILPMTWRERCEGDFGGEHQLPVWHNAQ